MGLLVVAGVALVIWVIAWGIGASRMTVFGSLFVACVALLVFALLRAGKTLTVDGLFRALFTVLRFAAR